MDIDLKQLFSYYKPYKKQLAKSLIFAFLSSIIVIIIPIVTRYATTHILKLSNSNVIKGNTVLLAAIISLIIINFFCANNSKYLERNIGAAIYHDMRMKLFRYYEEQSFEFFDENETGKLVSTLYVDVHIISDFLYRAPEFILEFFIRFIGAFVVFFYINFWLSIIIFLIFILSIAHIIYFAPIAQKRFVKIHESVTNISGYVEEALSGIRITQSFANEEFEYKKFQKISQDYLKKEKAISKIIVPLNTGLNSFVSAIVPLVTMISMFFVINHSICLNDLITYILYVEVLTSPIFILVSILSNYQDAFAGYQRFTEILKNKPKITDSKEAIEITEIKGQIEFKNISFCYPTSQKYILKNFNLKIKPCEYIALIGASGVGKTTLCNLIPRFYDVLDGEILIDNFNIKNIKLNSLRQNIGLVAQDTFLFSGSVFENIIYGKPNATQEEVFKAANNAYASNFIEEFKDGYNTQIGPKGVKLSYGQKQRISIARVFLKNPPILIFDEATSNLDTESERYIQQSMENLFRNRTTIVIAHRLSTIKNAKRILVMQDGKIIEEGAHKELVDKKGVYANFYNFL